MSSLAGAAVALVILIDLATGQGPPAYNNYMATQKAASNYGPPPPIPPMTPLRLPIQGYEALGTEYNEGDDYGKKPEKEYSKDYNKEADKSHENKKLMFKDEKQVPKKYQPDDYSDYTTTAKPGMFDSWSNSMSGMWSRFGWSGCTML